MRSLPRASVNRCCGHLRQRVYNILAPALDFSKRQSRELLTAFVLAVICAIVVERYGELREAETLRQINEAAVIVGCQPNFCPLHSEDKRTPTAAGVSAP